MDNILFRGVLEGHVLVIEAWEFFSIENGGWSPFVTVNMSVERWVLSTSPHCRDRREEQLPGAAEIELAI